MLLIHPPVAKPGEPPAGIARLTGVLRGHGLPCTMVDASLEGLFYLLNRPVAATDTWSRRAVRNLGANLSALRTRKLYANTDQYRRAVADVNRVAELAGRKYNIQLNLANYQDRNLSPLKSADLLRAAATPEANIFFPYFSERLSELVTTDAPPLIGFSLNYLSQAPAAFAMAGFIKQQHPRLPVVLGGGLVTSWLRNPNWQNPFAGLIDHLIAGPGENALLDLLQAPSGRHYQPPDFDALPLGTYLSPGFILPYSASSGCYWNKCAFCPEKAEGNPYLPVPPEQVLEDIEILRTRTNPSLLHLLDNAVSPALMKAMIDRPPGTPWYGFARVSQALADTDFCRTLRKSGCVMLKLGIESGDQGVLDAMHKGIDLKLVSRSLESLAQAGIATYVYLLFGTPAESIVEARRTLDFVVRHAHAVTFLNLAVFNMPLNSPETSLVATSDFYEGDLSLYTDFTHPRGWTRQNIRQFLDREFKRHPAITAILRRDPPLFTSNHAPFFC